MMSDSSDYPTDDMRPHIEEAITRFENQFHHNKALRIETFLKNQQQGNGQGVLNVLPELTAELIYVEMDLRFESGQELTKREYLERFPQYESVISDAWKRLANLDANNQRVDEDFVVSVENTSADISITELVVIPGGVSQVPKQLGRFKNLTFLGKGGFGLVYKAFDEQSKQLVALKFPRLRRQNGRIIDSDALKMVFEEASKSAGLDHDGIVRTISTETIDNFAFVVLEYVDGQDLRSSLDKKRTHQQIAELIAKIADALSYAHNQRIIHRDLKPANILLTKNGEPKITDFGLAFHDSIQLDLPDGRCGTPYYMSPQLAQGLNRQIDGRNDIFSLGVIFYELLTGERPFVGKDEQEVFRQIENRDPKPPRQIDKTIDAELEWICLKCLEKRAADRFTVAQDLAEHLRKWGKSQELLDETSNAEQSDTATHTKKETNILPRGLRSYGPEDAEAFMQLLPGLRDHKGVPSSIRFWQVRIREPVAQENRVPVGVIYGPSGSGKSSFVKAGLLPNLGSAITHVYVESTRDDTEVRIIKALRRRFPDIPNEKSLPQIMAGLAEGEWGVGNQKVLLVIDQFEQRLSINDDYTQSQLARALRHCNGENVQCLLLVRDDFWLGLTRFADALEMDLLEGHNSHDIDLFDKQHAQKVLIKLGQAYKRLPQGKDLESLSKNERSFVKEAVEQLSVGNYVICVRLALFAEMFKDRDWTRDELKKVGGVQGVGETFLESTFGTESRSKKYQLQKTAAQAVLSELLPETGTDIRGSMKPEADLRRAANLENRPERFNELINTLDNELKLITRTSPDDPESNFENYPSSNTENTHSHFQLTHDYLVQTIRNWLDLEQKKTSAGRARLRLRDLATQVRPNETPKNLPTHFEWLMWQFLVPQKKAKENEQKILKAAKTRFLKDSATILSICAILILCVGLIIWKFLDNDQRKKDIAGLIEDLKSHDISKIPSTVEQLHEFGDEARSQLTKHFLLEQDAAKKLRLELAALSFDSNNYKTILNYATSSASSPNELVVIAELLTQYRVDVREEINALIANKNAQIEQRFRAACLSCLFYDRLIQPLDNSLIVDSLSNEPTQWTDKFISILKPVGPYLVPELKLRFSAESDRIKTHIFAKALTNFDDNGSVIDFFSDSCLQLSNPQFGVVIDVAGTGLKKNELLNSLQTKLLNFNSDHKSKAKIAIALLGLGEKKPLWEMANNNESYDSRLWLINFADDDLIQFHALKSLYENNTRKLNNTSGRQTLLLMIAQLISERHIDYESKIWLKNVAEQLVKSDCDACCFSSGLLILRRLGTPENEIEKCIAIRRESSDSRGILGNVLVNQQLMPFSILTLEKNSKVRKVAVSMYELAENQWTRYKKSEQSHLARSFGKPLNCRDVIELFEYCNWLSESNGNDKCYDGIHTLEDVRSRSSNKTNTGYRLPTESEWMTICGRSNAFINLKKDVEFSIFDHACLLKNSQNIDTGEDIGTRLPNFDGLFDTIGNMREMCEQPANDSVTYTLKGHSCRDSVEYVSLDSSFPAEIRNPSAFLQGIRIIIAFELRVRKRAPQ